jgi:hypothetical protein
MACVSSSSAVCFATALGFGRVVKKRSGEGVRMTVRRKCTKETEYKLGFVTLSANLLS